MGKRMNWRKGLGLTIVSFFFFAVVLGIRISCGECSDEESLFTTTGKTQDQELQDEIKDLPNLLMYGDFEVPEGAKLEDTIYKKLGHYGSGYEIDTKVFHSGKASMRFDLDYQKPFAERVGGAIQAFNGSELGDQKLPYTLLVSGWGKAQEVNGAQFGYYLDMFFEDGTRDVWRDGAQFQNGTHDWEFMYKKFKVTKKISAIYVYFMFRWSYTGVGWVDDMKICVLKNEK